MNTTPSHDDRPTRWGASLLIAVGVLAFSPLAVLAPAIGWPASLGLPPDKQLALIHANKDAVSLGYSLYLLYSVAVTPAMLLLAYHALGSLARPAAATAAAFAALSSLARAIGISRWLTTMPVLATAWAEAPAGEKGVLETTFLAVTEFGGGVGELLGVSLFMAAAVGVLSVSAWHAGVLPRALSALGMLTSLFLAALALPSVGVPVDFPVAVAVSTQSFWMLACGVWMWRRASAARSS
ncbi:MAG: DUF4386 domain-containing protein [Rubrivivax sp.]|jgi:hypothetical protein|nr:DUF4386 domain-containing protein [Rubrivivax sp.]